MMVETHLGPKKEVHRTHLKEVIVTFISPLSDMTGTDQIKHTLSCLDQ